jgi:hypothetical protein
MALDPPLPFCETKPIRASLTTVVAKARFSRSLGIKAGVQRGASDLAPTLHMICCFGGTAPLVIDFLRIRHRSTGHSFQDIRTPTSTAPRAAELL